VAGRIGVLAHHYYRRFHLLIIQYQEFWFRWCNLYCWWLYRILVRLPNSISRTEHDDCFLKGHIFRIHRKELFIGLTKPTWFTESVIAQFL
jgi:hypothetical protein